MNVLLVDDQPNVISSLVSCIPWRRMGFSSIYTASSVNNAREILNKNQVDILITDIEMPEEDGLALIHWVREKGINVECILLTSHADFFYAQQAISLRVSEYIVQPARDEDIIRAVNNAISILKDKQLQKEPDYYHGYDFYAKNAAIKAVFGDWPAYEDVLREPELLGEHVKQLSRYGHTRSPNDACTILYARIRKWHKIPLSPAALLTKYNDLLTGLSPHLGGANLSFFMEDNAFFSVLFIPLTDQLQKELKRLYALFDTELGCSIRLFYCSTDMAHLKATLSALHREELHFSAENPSDAVCLQEVQSAVGSSENDDSPEQYRQYMESIRKFILKNISEPITRTQIAEALFLSPSHLSHIVRVVEDMTCKELITKIKMEYARKLLLNTKCPVGDIATRCGYDSFAYFSKVYKQTFSVTPSAERENKNE